MVLTQLTSGEYTPQLRVYGFLAREPCVVLQGMKMVFSLWFHVVDRTCVVRCLATQMFLWFLPVLVEHLYRKLLRSQTMSQWLSGEFTVENKAVSSPGNPQPSTPKAASRHSLLQ